MPNTPKKVETRSSLERKYWIAGILSAPLMAGSLIWSVWTYFKPPGELPQAPLASAVNSSNGTIFIQGSGNTVVAPQSTPTEKNNTQRFVEIKISNRMLDFQDKRRHEVHFPQIAGDIPHDTLERVNHFLKRSALTEYERYADEDEVRISYDVGLREFNLLGINYEIFANSDKAAHPMTSTSAVTVDLETGSAIALKDLFKSNYIDKLNELVRAKLTSRERYYPCGNVDAGTKMVQDVIENITGHPADACFKSISGENQYYLTDTSLVLVFPKYSIASGADGDIEIPIYFKEIQGILNPSGPLQRFL